MAFKTSVTYATITGKAAYQLARGEVSYRDVTVAEIKLGAYSLNQRPIDQFSFADLAAIETQKNTLDSIGFTDAQAVAMAKGVVDSIGFSEAFEVLLVIERAFSDSFAISDFSAVAIHKGLVDTVGFSDAFGRVATYFRNFTDAFGLDELVNVNPNSDFDKTNVFSFTENFSYEVGTIHNSVLNSSALNTYTLNS